MLFHLDSSTPGSRRRGAPLVLLLAAVAGAVNAAGFFALGTHSSHMSGHVAEVGEALAVRTPGLAAASAWLLLAFFLGAASAAVLVELMQHRPRGRHAPALLLEASVLAVVSWGASHGLEARASVLLAGLSYAMGMQNALITRVSGAVVRTTHMTGVVTDLGLEVVRVLRFVRDAARGRGVRDLPAALLQLSRAVELERVWLHLALLLAFLLGAAGGPLLYLRRGATVALAVPALALVALACADLVWGRPPQPHAAHPAPSPR